jgi:hypothetical protein
VNPFPVVQVIQSSPSSASRTSRDEIREILAISSKKYQARSTSPREPGREELGAMGEMLTPDQRAKIKRSIEYRVEVPEIPWGPLADSKRPGRERWRFSPIVVGQYGCRQGGLPAPRRRPARCMTLWHELPEAHEETDDGLVLLVDGRVLQL